MTISHQDIASRLDDIDMVLDVILSKLIRLSADNRTLKAQGKHIMANLDALVAEVEEQSSVIDSVTSLIEGLRQQIIDAGTDQTKLDAVVASLDANNQKLAGAVAASEDVDPAPEPAPDAA